MKIAIVGSGISGMTCGHLLSSHHETHLFESEQRLGGHTHTVSVEVPSGQYHIDTGFIVFNNKNYPNFVKLMNKLGVASQASTMSFSVKVEKSGLEYNGTTLNALFCQRKNILNPRFYQMIFDIMRFNKQATQYYLQNSDAEDGKTLEEYLKEHNFSEEFTECYIMPMGAAIWSASRQEMKRFPLGFFVRFFHHHGLLTIDDRPEWRVLQGGSHSYIKPLVQNFSDRIHLNTPVLSAERNSAGVAITILRNGERETHQFDEVIFATHADQTMKILQNPTEDEKAVMSGFSYRPNDVILHTDESVLPDKTLGHASWNYFLPKEPKERVAVTYHMNILQGLEAPEKFLVSLNMDEYIDPKKILKKIPYSHPVYTIEAIRSQGLWEKMSGVNRIHFCGAYWGNGFHEDGVKSALRVCEKFGVTL